MIKLKSYKRKIYIKYISLKMILIYIHIFYIFKEAVYNLDKNEITLISALFKLQTPRHKFEDYFRWVKNLLKLNKPIIFYVDSLIANVVKESRPKEYRNKTIWVELNFSELFFYRRYRKELQKTYIIDKAKYHHNVDLFTVWNEKLIFLKKAINKNYFHSNYFFWVDAGFFRDKNMTKYINNWPSLKKVKEDPRVMLNEIRKIDKKEFDNLMKFDQKTHEKFMNNYNMGGAFFGGRYDYLIKFVYSYFDVFKLFLKNNKFIGSEQNLCTIVGYLHPEFTNIIHTGNFFIMKEYFLDKNISFLNSKIS